MSDQRVVYSYVPWVRRGIATALAPTGRDRAPGRANPEFPVTLRMQSRKGNQVFNEPARVDLRLHGPGDVLGIDPGQIARTDPRSLARDFEPNCLAAVDFVSPDFPWLFTPFGAAESRSLQPWLALIVVAASEGTVRSHPRRPLPTLEISDPAEAALKLPDLAESGHWAHVQALHDPATEGPLTEETLATLVRDHPERVVSRLVCPRRLSAHTDYLACLVPTFKVGVDRGLGLEVHAGDGFRLAWDISSPPAAITLPVYFQWEFSTGTAGGFESLTRLLKARPAPAELGTRPMDISDPGFGMEGSSGSVVAMESALRAPSSQTEPWGEEERRGQLRGILNRSAADREGPAVAPPLYGQFAAQRETVPELGVRPRWFGDLNLDPRWRAAAGAGAEVVRRNREALLQAAWLQVGEIVRANQLLRQAQLARAVGEKFLRRLSRMSDSALLQVTAPSHTRLLADLSTFRARIESSAFPGATLSGAYRRRFGFRRPGDAVSAKREPRSANRAPAKLSLPDGAVTMSHVRSTAPRVSLPALITEHFGAWIGVSFTLGLLLLATLVAVMLTNYRLPLTLEGGLAAAALTAFGSLFRLRKLRFLSRVRRHLEADSLTAARVLESSPRPNFEVVGPGAPFVRRHSGNGPDSPSAKRFREAAARQLEATADEEPTAEDRPALELSDTARLVREGLSPSKTIPARVRARIQLSNRQWNPLDPIAPIQAVPQFADAMHRPLSGLSPHHLVAGLDRLSPNTVTLLKTNAPFIEAYLVGLNHEMGRELLWRGYPTDSRATFFRQFWDPGPAASDPPDGHRGDIPPIHTWAGLSALGEHLATGSDKLVLLIKGELIRRYPDTAVSLVRAEWADGESDQASAKGIQVFAGRYRRPVDSPTEEDLRWPLFSGTVSTDIIFQGFDLTVAEARGEVDPDGNPIPEGDPGWFVTLREPPGQARFGLPDAGGETPLKGVSDLTWDHVLPEGPGYVQVERDDLKAVQSENSAPCWGANSAHMACIFLRQPVMVAIDAAELLTSDGASNQP